MDRMQLAYSGACTLWQVGDRRHLVDVHALPIVTDLDAQDAAACSLSDSMVSLIQGS